MRRHTPLFFSYSREHVSAIVVSVESRSEAAREKRKRLIAWFPQGAFSYLNVFPCVMALEAVLFLPLPYQSPTNLVNLAESPH